MKRWPAFALAMLLMITSAPAFAAEPPIGSFSRLNQNIETMDFHGEVRISMELLPLFETMMLGFDEQDEAAKMIIDQYVPALNALMNNMSLLFDGDANSSLIHMMLGETEVFNITAVNDQETGAISFLSDLIPSYKIVSGAASDLPANKMKPSAEKIIQALREVDGDQNLMKALTELLYQAADAALADADQKTLTAAEMRDAIKSKREEMMTENEEIAALCSLFAAVEFDVDRVYDHFWPGNDAVYTLQKSDDEINIQVNKDGQRDAATLQRDYFCADTASMNPERIVIDVSEKNLTQLRMVDRGDYLWINASENSTGATYSFHYSLNNGQREAGMRGQFYIDPPAENIKLSVEILYEETAIYGYHINLAFNAKSEESLPQDLSHYKPLELTANVLGGIDLSAEDQEKLRREAFPILQPRLIDIIFSKLPKGAESLTSLLLPLIMQMGR